MKALYLITSIICISQITRCQDNLIYQVRIQTSADNSLIVELSNRGILIEMDDQGNLLHVYNNLSDGVKPDLYKTAVDSEKKHLNSNQWSVLYWKDSRNYLTLGKIRSVNSIDFNYWGAGWGAKEGKLKSIGTIPVDYWGAGWGVKEGKVKSIGTVSIDYWGTDWGVKGGKIKSLGNAEIEYWGKGWGEDKEGKIKSIVYN